MSYHTRMVAYVCCDNCGAKADGRYPPGWLEWKIDPFTGEDLGRYKHNCPACVTHGEERIAMGDPPG